MRITASELINILTRLEKLSGDLHDLDYQLEEPPWEVFQSVSFLQTYFSKTLLEIYAGTLESETGLINGEDKRDQNEEGC